MARTPLLSMLERLAKDVAIAKAKNVSVETVQDWRKEAREKRRRNPTRREMIVGAGAAAAALALPRSSKAAAQPRIAIIGAGISGLCASLTLADKGLSSTVYEASGRIGGRMHSNNSGYWNEGQVSEWCGELIDTGHLTIRQLAQRFRLPLVDLFNSEDPGSEDTFYFNGQFYPRSQANKDFTHDIHPVLSKDRADASYPTLYNSNTATGRMLDNMSMWDYIETKFPGGHSSAMGSLIDVAYTEELANDTHDLGAINLVDMLGWNQTPGNFEIFGISDERFHIVGGNDQLPKTIASYLGNVVTGYRMNAIKKNADTTYTLTFQVGSKTQTVSADYVVLALPFAVLRNLDFSKAGFDPLKTKVINELGAGKSGKLQVQTVSRPWRGVGAWPGKSNGNSYADTGFQNTWEVSRGQPGTSGLIVDYTGGPPSIAMTTKLPYAFIGDAGVSTDVNRFFNQINPVFPGLRTYWNGKATSSLPHLDPNILCSYAIWKTGQHQTLAGYEGARQGNCIFAGEQCSIDFQGFMEGGASEGVRAGNDILKDLKKI